jgi:ATP-dependent RNA helicase SUPV3L1/SUV3
VTEEVKSLDQDARASMRRYGVRFGAYHIFVPALLKPAPAELITLLWALKNDGLDKPGYGDLIPVLAAGRTSVVTDPSFERMFYKLAGFRFLGKRAVRIDILERLADIIRPLLQWKPGQASRPEGAYDGRRFTTTTAMLSILGATLEDMEEILKGLGYRADPVKTEEVAAYLAQQDATSAPTADATGAAEETAEKADHDDADGSAEEPASPEAGATAPEAGVVAPQEAAAAADVASELPGADVVAAEPAEPKPVLLWRLGGRGDNQRQARGHGDRRGQHAQGHEQRQGQQGNRRNGGEQGGEGRDNRGPRGKGNGNRDGGRPQQGHHADRGDRNDRGDRQERRDRNDRNDRNNNRGGGNQPLRFEAKPPRKEKPIDPDSPFAKLAALKEQMKK